MAYVCVEPCEDALNKFNEFKKTKNITTIMLNIRKIEGIDHVVFVKNFFQDSTEEDIINSLPDYEPIFIYRKINLNNKEEKIISIVFFPINARSKQKMLTLSYTKNLILNEKIFLKPLQLENLQIYIKRTY